MIRARLLCGLCFLALCFPVQTLLAEQLFLVSSKQMSITPLSSNEIKKLFLSIPVTRQGKKLSPILNQSNALTYQIFLQTVMGRSANTYEKQLLSRVYASGIAPPPVISDLNELYNTLLAKPGVVSFMLERDFDDGELQKIQKLWEGTIQ